MSYFEFLEKLGPAAQQASQIRGTIFIKVRFAILRENAAATADPQSDPQAEAATGRRTSTPPA